jgi:hypothetical protein
MSIKVISNTLSLDDLRMEFRSFKLKCINNEIEKEVEKNETKSSVSDQWKEIERLNELNIFLMSKRDS